MKGSNVDELQKLVTAATNWRNVAGALNPTPVEINQINAVIEGRNVVLAWNAEENEWEVTAS